MISMRIKIGLVALALVSGATNVRSQVFEPGEEPRTVRTEGFWENWFVQMGLDMTLQNPYGYDFSKVFPNGKSFGLDLAVGKWFTHQVGVRGKFKIYHFHQTKRTKNSRIVAKNVKRPGKESIFSEAFGC